jgi:hypothetical protein
MKNEVDCLSCGQRFKDRDNMGACDSCLRELMTQLSMMMNGEIDHYDGYRHMWR